MRALTTILVVLMLGAKSSHGEPVAPWADFSRLDEEKALGLHSFRRAACEPPQSYEVDAPIAPDLQLVVVGCLGAPHECSILDGPGPIQGGYECPSANGGREIDHLILISKTPVLEVAAWYRMRLDSGYTEYPVEDLEAFFLRKKVESFDFNKHYRSAPSITVQSARSIFREAGYESIVEIYRPAL